MATAVVASFQTPGEMLCFQRNGEESLLDLDCEWLEMNNGGLALPPEAQQEHKEGACGSAKAM